MQSRVKGILLPVFSLPGKEGIGTLGVGARFFIDFLKETGQNYWQILPLGPVGQGNSPYSSTSAFAGNELFIDLEELYKKGLLKEKPKERENTGRVDYKTLKAEKMPWLILAAKSFKQDKEFLKFLRENEFWLSDYAKYREKREKIP
ncbi:MAG: 4-alpha-glucanotransferase, partial [Clostridia bacterium]|nr:4-alpha-glucanotransferase [Clostridia bacterium]